MVFLVRLFLMARGLFLMARGLFLMARGLFLMARGLFLMARGLFLMARGLFLMARGLFLMARGLHLHLLMVFLYIPVEFWIVGAKGFSQMKYKERKDIAQQYQLAMELMAYTRQVVDAKNENMKIALKCQITYELVLARGSSMLDPPRKRKYAGRRLRLIAPNGGMRFGWVIQDLIDQNARAGVKKISSGVKSVPSSAPPRPGMLMRGMSTSLTKHMWERMCDMLSYTQSLDTFIDCFYF